MGHATCCVVNCRNTGRNSNCRFYYFPVAKHKLDQRKQWINSVKRINCDGTQWCPRPSDKICSEHFVGNKKGNEQNSPNYIPTIFPSIYKAKMRNETAATKRHERFMARRKRKEATTIKTKISEELSMLKDTYIKSESESIQTNFVTILRVDQECLVETSLTSTTTSNTFICNRYIYNDKFNDVEIQTDIVESSYNKIHFI